MVFVILGLKPIKAYYSGCAELIRFPTLMHPLGGWVFVVDVTRRGCSVRTFIGPAHIYIIGLRFYVLLSTLVRGPPSPDKTNQLKTILVMRT